MSSEKKYMESLCFRLKNINGLSISEISKETGLSVDKIVDYIAGYRTRRTKENTIDITTAITNNASSDPAIEAVEDVEFEDTLNKEEDYFTLPDGRDKSLYLHKNADRQREKISQFIEEKYRGRTVKVLYMSDLHIPFTMYDLVQHAVNENKDANILVLNGDLLDLFAVSTFAKDKTVALKRELQEGRTLLEQLAEVFDDIVVVEGNHERRLKNYIKNVIPVDMHFLFPQDVLQVVKDGTVFDLEPLENVHIVGSWWVKLFDTIFAHPDNYSSVTMRTVIQTSEHFLLVKNVPHRACVIGHTHQAGKLIDRGRLVMETGCMSHDMDYKHGSKFIKTTWTRAYAVFLFDENGEVQFNESELTVFPV